MVSLYEASHGHTAKTTASRNAAGKVVGNSQGSNYVRNQQSSRSSNPGGSNRGFSYTPSSVPSPVSPQYASTYFKNLQSSKSNQISLRTPSQGFGNVYGMPSRPTTSKNFVIENNLPKSFKSGFSYIDKGVPFAPKTGSAPLAPQDHYTFTVMKGAEKLGGRVTSKLNSFVSRIPEPQNPSANLLTRGAKHLVLGVSDVPGQFIDMGGKIPYGLETMARDPRNASRNIGMGAGVMAAGMKQGVTNDPLRFAGQMFVGPKVGGKALKVSKGAVKSTTGAVDMSIPTTSGMARYKGVYVQSPLGLKPVAGLKNGKPVLGTPSFKIKSGYTPKTSVELSITKPSIKSKMSPAQAAQWDAGFQVVDALKNIKVPNAKQVPLADIKYIPPKARPIVQKWISENPKHQIYGSATQKAQLGKGRTPADLDIGVLNADSARSALSTRLSKTLGKDNVKIDGAAISVKQNGGWHHAVDIHELADMSKGTMDFGFKTQEPLKIGSQRQTRIGEQLERKAASVLVPRDKIGFGPKPHRVKDIGDFTSTAEGLIEVGKLSKNPVTKLKAKKGERALEIYKGERDPHTMAGQFDSFFEQTRALMGDTSAEFLPAKKMSSPLTKEKSVRTSAKQPQTKKSISGDEYLKRVTHDEFLTSKLSESPITKKSSLKNEELYPKVTKQKPAPSRSRKYPSLRKPSTKKPPSSKYPGLSRPATKPPSKGYPPLSKPVTNTKYPSTTPKNHSSNKEKSYPPVNIPSSKIAGQYGRTVQDRPHDPSPPVTTQDPHPTTTAPYPYIINPTPTPPVNSPVPETKKETKKPPKFPLDSIDDPLDKLFSNKKGRGKKTAIKIKTASEMMGFKPPKPASVSSRSSKPKPKPKTNTRKTKRTTTKRRAKK